MIGDKIPSLTGLVPRLPALSAPGWVREGVRVSYYSAVANVLSAYERFILDENGDWVGQTTGNRYRREELYGAAGHGVTQVDVLSVDDEYVALQVNSWQYSVFTGPLVPNGQAPWIGPASGGDWFLHPSVLAGQANQTGGGLTILRMPYTIGEVTYDAIRIQQDSEQATCARVYDLTNGTMLALFGAVTTQEGTLFSEAIFIGARRMNLPWLGRTVPDWVTSGRTLTYAGTKSWEAIRAGTVLTANVALRMRIDQVNPAAFTYRRTTTTTVTGYPSQSQEEDLAGGVGEPTSLVLPPASLAELRAGQVIDADPVTGIRVEVTDVNRDVVAIEARNRGFSARLTYDADSGVMLGYTDQVTSEETRTYSSLRLSSSG
ncbi:MAG: hypothetical protein WCF12_05555 [Propionicimonas sp.]